MPVAAEPVGPDRVEGDQQEVEAARPARGAELESAVKMFLEILRGFESFDFEQPCVTVFGSARFRADHRYYELARETGRALAEAGYDVELIEFRNAPDKARRFTVSGGDSAALRRAPQATLTDVAEVRDEESFKPRIAVKGVAALDEKKLKKAEETLIDVGTAGMDALKKAVEMGVAVAGSRSACTTTPSGPLCTKPAIPSRSAQR